MGVDIPHGTTTMNTPVFEISAQGVVDQYEYTQELVDHVYFSAKTNYDVVSILQDRTDAGFSIHFEHALEHTRRDDTVIFHANSVTPDQLSRLRSDGIDTFVVDNPADLNILESWLNGDVGPVTVLLRLQRRENTVETGKHYAYGLSSTVVNNAVPRLADQEAVRNIGVHVHRKTQNVAEWRLRDELDDVLDDETKHAIDVVNAGGGIPVQYHNYQRDVKPAIEQRFKELREWTDTIQADLIIEPGRIISGPPGRLKTTITNVYDDTVVIDASVYNAAMDTFVTNTRLPIMEETESGDPYTVKGCTPDSLDILRYKARLNNPERGDTLTFDNATAYNYSSDFCDLPEPRTNIIE